MGAGEEGDGSGKGREEEEEGKERKQGGGREKAGRAQLAISKPPRLPIQEHTGKETEKGRDSRRGEKETARL